MNLQFSSLYGATNKTSSCGNALFLYDIKSVNYSLNILHTYIPLDGYRFYVEEPDRKQVESKVLSN